MKFYRVSHLVSSVQAKLQGRAASHVCPIWLAIRLCSTSQILLGPGTFGWMTLRKLFSSGSHRNVDRCLACSTYPLWQISGFDSCANYVRLGIPPLHSRVARSEAAASYAVQPLIRALAVEDHPHKPGTGLVLMAGRPVQSRLPVTRECFTPF